MLKLRLGSYEAKLEAYGGGQRANFRRWFRIELDLARWKRRDARVFPEHE